MAIDIRHVVVLMLENRSFDSMLGALYPERRDFDGLTGAETNVWRRLDGTEAAVPVWTGTEPAAAGLGIPERDPGELFDDICAQIGLRPDGSPDPGIPAMGGFVNNYMRQPLSALVGAANSVMHYFTPAQVPVLSGLASAFGVCDRWHASAPCQTWPNRFFAHCGTASGYVNNLPTHFPYRMETVFNRLSDAGQSWRVYFHDIPHTALLSRLWGGLRSHFSHFEAFQQDAAKGDLPAYSFIEPRYFPHGAQMPSDGHSPHNLAWGEQLIAAVYNAARGGAGWKNTLLIVTFDEHGGCFDHVPPPAATPPGGPCPDGFSFNRFGVRVPAVIASPYVRPGSVIRPRGETPFDHTSIIATLRALHGFAPLTARDAAAPSLLDVLEDEVVDMGPESIAPPKLQPDPAEVGGALRRTVNRLQMSLGVIASVLPAVEQDIAAHIRALAARPDPEPTPQPAGDAAQSAMHRVRAFLGW